MFKSDMQDIIKKTGEIKHNNQEILAFLDSIGYKTLQRVDTINIPEVGTVCQILHNSTEDKHGEMVLCIISDDKQDTSFRPIHTHFMSAEEIILYLLEEGKI